MGAALEARRPRLPEVVEGERLEARSIADLPELSSHVGHRLLVPAAAGLARAAVPPGYGPEGHEVHFQALGCDGAREVVRAGGCRTTRGFGAAYSARAPWSCDEHQRKPDGKSKASHVSIHKDGAARR